MEKVVFNLHESFPKPKRVIKEPPYSVKEAGYAGFVLTIDICFKNRDEPKKFSCEYDLDLQPFKTQVNELVITTPVSDEFKKKCLKGGCVLLNAGDYKSREPYKNPPIPSTTDIKKTVKRPEETKATKTFTDLFGAPLKKPDPQTVQNASPNPSKMLQVMATKAAEKSTTLSTLSTKEKVEKSKHKHSQDGKEVRKSDDSRSDLPEKSKKERTKDRDRSEKKEKSSKRQASPSQSFPPSTTAGSRNSTNLNSLPQLKTELGKSKQQTSGPTNDLTFSKKSSKKDKKSDKEREKCEKKESRTKESSSKEKFEPVLKGNDNAQRDRPLPTKDEREKTKTKSNTTVEHKHLQVEDVIRKHNEKEIATKNKHRKRDKTKDKDLVKEMKKEKQHKSSTVIPSPVKTKDSAVPKYDQTAPKNHLSDKDSSDSDADSPPSDSSISDSIVQKPVEKGQKKPRERTKATDKEEKSRKRKVNKKDEREGFDSMPPSKQQRKDLSKSPSLQDRPSSSNSYNTILDVTNKLPCDYMTELKDLKQKITTLKSNDDLQTVVRMIAATGCYEITKSSFDFDLVQLDRTTVQKLQAFLTVRD